MSERARVASITSAVASVRAHMSAGPLRVAGMTLLGSWLDDSGPLGLRAPTAAARVAAPPSHRRAERSRVRLAFAVAAIAGVVGLTPVTVQGAPERNVGSGRGQAAPETRVVAERAAEGSSGATAQEDGSDRAAVGPLDAAGTLRKPLRVDAKRPRTAHRVIRYRTQAGDSLWLISRKFGITPLTIWWANPLKALDFVHKGKTLRLAPVPGTIHVVRDGDTLESIARVYHADAARIAEYNRLEGGIPIIGQRLIIPDGRGPKYTPLDEVPEAPPPVPGLQVLDDEVLRTGPAHVAFEPFTPEAGAEQKETGGVGWPLPAEATAHVHGGAWTWSVMDNPTAIRYASKARGGLLIEPTTVEPDDRAGQGRGDREPAAGRHDPAAERRDRAELDPGSSGDTAGRVWDRERYPDGPPRGPARGVVIDIDDPRLTLTGQQVLRERSFHWPVKGGGYITQPFHHFEDDWEHEHLGVDIASRLGTPILAAADGRVMFRGWRDNRSGYSVWIKHGPRLYTAYVHLSKIDVNLGEFVRKGQTIARMGSTGYSTGPHLHFSVSVGGDRPDIAAYRVDPLRYLPER